MAIIFVSVTFIMFEKFERELKETTNKCVLELKNSILSAYAPIKNSEGNIVAITGVDIDASMFESIRSTLLKSIIFTIIILYIIKKITSQYASLFRVMRKLDSYTLVE